MMMFDFLVIFASIHFYSIFMEFFLPKRKEGIFIEAEVSIYPVLLQ
jgi:hypothetical protein